LAIISVGKKMNSGKKRPMLKPTREKESLATFICDALRTEKGARGKVLCLGKRGELERIGESRGVTQQKTPPWRQKKANLRKGSIREN